MSDSSRTKNDHDAQVRAFLQAIEPHQRTLYGIALAYCKDSDQASDLTQEALVRAYQAFDRFVAGSPVLPWLRRILRNLYFDTFKTSRARHEVTERELLAEERAQVVESIADGPDPFQQVERAQLLLWMDEEIAELASDHREVLTLCVMRDLGYEEAAAVLEIPVGTVASRIGRARAQLRQRMLERISRSERDSGDGSSRSPNRGASNKKGKPP